MRAHLKFNEGLRFEEGGVVWSLVPRCTLLGFIHRTMTCELQVWQATVCMSRVFLAVWDSEWVGASGEGYREP